MYTYVIVCIHNMVNDIGSSVYEMGIPVSITCNIIEHYQPSSTVMTIN